MYFFSQTISYLSCIVADYIMPKGVNEIEVPRRMQKKVIGELCEFLKMGTVSHLEGNAQSRQIF